jgi:Uma2 family endonuclease
MIVIPAGFSPQEYLVMEQENAIRHEYRQGLVYAMAGGSDNHNGKSPELSPTTSVPSTSTRLC